MSIRLLKKSDLHQVNGIISRAFTQGRLDDGYAYTDVPMCKPEFLAMYYAQCPQGCFVLEESGHIQGAVFCHVWGKTGWFGPLVLAPEKHHLGLGKQLTQHAVSFLKGSGCVVIGMEVNPRSSRNIGFYGKMHFIPSVLSIDMIKPVPAMLPAVQKSPHQLVYYSRLSKSERLEFLQHASHLTKAVMPTIDYKPVIQAIDEIRQGESVLCMLRGTPVGLAVMQTEPSLVEEQNAMLRLISFVAHPKTPASYIQFFLHDFLDLAKSASLDRIMIRVPMYSNRLFKILLRNNYRVVSSDMRFVLEGYADEQIGSFFHVNRWV
ncbi:GNAT family N-acetyltransferase [candidate division KSB1 bacterium]|nr:GNAT family N-acetyltransferase [candidate division KSB1 bacterium]RQW09997.1 MAG: GNAT family N-acetyltransferase [candidate division KSB1 bacterium]